jgi:hypothetical protein
MGLEQLMKFVNTEKYIPYDVNCNNILGLSRKYDGVKPEKDSFLSRANAEICKPTILKNRIIPYAKPDNLEFKAIMDCLNPAFLQRELGAYYTPAAYAKKCTKCFSGR